MSLLRDHSYQRTLQTLRRSPQERTLQASLGDAKRALAATAREVRQFSRRQARSTLPGAIREAVRSVASAQRHLLSVEQTIARETQLRKDLRQAAVLLGAITVTCAGMEKEAHDLSADLTYATAELRKASELLRRTEILQETVLEEVTAEYKAEEKKKNALKEEDLRRRGKTFAPEAPFSRGRR